MRITIGNNTRKMMKILAIEEYPFTSKQLKTNYREMLLKFHPDHNKSKDSEDTTKQIIHAFKTLSPLAIDVNESDVIAQKEKLEKENKDIFDMSIPCKKCHGIGKKKEMYHGKRPCLKCSSTIFFLLGGVPGSGKHECNACHGTGKFKQARSGRIVSCLRCKGTGFVICRDCKGTGFIGKDEMQEINCIECKGTGKIIVNPFNPVIPKGAVL